MKTKAQLNWKIGKEQEERFIEENYNILGRNRERLKLLFQQIRQTEYRRGKEEGVEMARKEFLEWLESKVYYNENEVAFLNEKDYDIATIMKYKMIELRQQLGGKA